MAESPTINLDRFFNITNKNFKCCWVFWSFGKIWIRVRKIFLPNPIFCTVYETLLMKKTVFEKYRYRPVHIFLSLCHSTLSMLVKMSFLMISSFCIGMLPSAGLRRETRENCSCSHVKYPPLYHSLLYSVAQSFWSEMQFSHFSTVRWLYHRSALTVFRIMARSFSAVINFHSRENRPQSDGICVANHTTPIDVVILSCDRAFALVTASSMLVLGLSSSVFTVWDDGSLGEARKKILERLS